MYKFHLIYEIQNLDNEIKKVKEELENKATYIKLKEMQNVYNNIYIALSEKIKRLDTNNKNQEKLNCNINELDKKYKDYNNRLYENGNSIKQINNIQTEIELLKSKIDLLENDLLNQITEFEKINEEIKEEKILVKKYKEEFYNIKNNFIEQNKINQNKYDTLLIKKEEVVKNIEDDLMKLYNEISIKKNNPISIVENNLCTECGVGLNVLLINELKKGNKILNCEHCGRILYLIK